MRYEKFLNQSLFGVLGVLIFLVVWELAGFLEISSGLVPGFLETMRIVLEKTADGTFLYHAVPTLKRVIVGFGIGAGAGIGLGLVLGWSSRMRSLFDVLIDFLRNVSSITLIPITILIIGIGFYQKVSIVAYASFFPVLLNTIRGVSSTEQSMIEAARSMGASDFQVFRHVILPSSLPNIFTGLRLSISVAFIVVIAAELVGAQSGLGYYLMQSERTYRTTEVFATAFVISILGYLANKLIILLGNHTLKWKTYTVNKA